MLEKRLEFCLPNFLTDLRRRSVSSHEFDEDSLDGDHPYEHEGELKHISFTFPYIIHKFFL